MGRPAASSESAQLRRAHPQEQQAHVAARGGSVMKKTHHTSSSGTIGGGRAHSPQHRSGTATPKAPLTGAMAAALTGVRSEAQQHPAQRGLMERASGMRALKRELHLAARSLNMTAPPLTTSESMMAGRVDHSAGGSTRPSSHGGTLSRSSTHGVATPVSPAPAHPPKKRLATSSSSASFFIPPGGVPPDPIPAPFPKFKPAHPVHAVDSDTLQAITGVAKHGLSIEALESSFQPSQVAHAQLRKHWDFHVAPETAGAGASALAKSASSTSVSSPTSARPGSSASVSWGDQTRSASPLVPPGIFIPRSDRSASSSPVPNPANLYRSRSPSPSTSASSPSTGAAGPFPPKNPLPQVSAFLSSASVTLGADKKVDDKHRQAAMSKVAKHAPKATLTSAPFFELPEGSPLAALLSQKDLADLSSSSADGSTHGLGATPLSPERKKLADEAVAAAAQGYLLPRRDTHRRVPIIPASSSLLALAAWDVDVPNVDKDPKHLVPVPADVHGSPQSKHPHTLLRQKPSLSPDGSTLVYQEAKYARPFINKKEAATAAAHAAVHKPGTPTYVPQQFVDTATFLAARPSPFTGLARNFSDPTLVHALRERPAVLAAVAQTSPLVAHGSRPQPTHHQGRHSPPVPDDAGDEYDALTRHGLWSRESQNQQFASFVTFANRYILVRQVSNFNDKMLSMGFLQPRPRHELVRIPLVHHALPRG
jgi:hypothetical protein